MLLHLVLFVNSVLEQGQICPVSHIVGTHVCDVVCVSVAGGRMRQIFSDSQPGGRFLLRKKWLP